MCRLCVAHCGILVEVEGDRVVHVGGDSDHPLSQGYCCSKGRSLPQMHHDPDRLDHPEVDGQRVSWGRAIDDLATRLRRVIDTHGPNSVAIYKALGAFTDCNGRWALNRLEREIGTRQIYTTNTIDSAPKIYVSHLVVGTASWAPLIDWEQSKLVVYVGTNPVVSHGHLNAVTSPRVRIRDLKSRGGRIIVADPRKTETARLADVHVALRPGSDVAFLAFLVREVLEHRPDEQFLSEAADAESVDRLRAAVAPYDLPTAAAACGVPPVELEAARDLVLGTPRLVVQTGTGLTMQAPANVAEWLALALGAVTGSLDRPGGTYFNPGMLYPQEQQAATSSTRVTGPPPATRPEFEHAFGQYPCAVMADEILGGEVRALIVIGGNPVRVFPETEKLQAALRKLDVLALFDITRHEVADFATHLLPVADQFERNDIAVFEDNVFRFPFAQYLPQVVPPAAERRGLWRIMAELGEAMGMPLGISSDGDDDALLARAISRSRVPFDELRDAPVGVVGDDVPDPGWLVPDRLPRRLDLAPLELVAQLAELGGPTGSRESDETLVLINRRLPRQMNTILRFAPSQQRPPGPTLLMNPADASARNLDDGSRVSVQSEFGETFAEVEIDATMRPGVVSLPHAWGEPDVNRLTSDTAHVDPRTGMPLYSGISVSVQAAGAQAAHA
jgi:anaerobic selenocysteine-containing dehydrogenase